MPKLRHLSGSDVVRIFGYAIRYIPEDDLRPYFFTS